MKRVLPEPMLALALFVGWLMLNESASAGHLLLGAALALVVPWATRCWRPDLPHIANWRPVLRLSGIVLIDIVLSNVAVARRILGDEHKITPRFVRVPLALRDPHGVVALAGIVTMTPGTLSADLTEDRSELLVHAFDIDDDAAQAELVVNIQRRYEAPLIRIFEGGGS